ncbi:DsrE family protein [Campylobacter geochelonis]|uniref:Uncharacterized conserved protein n=1 Tax=Campylobacter geochelonis TaxID=1780362 RepID=A0A128EIJ9_9BACT|nr:DsrE family protein [Campylobacter geochelonis]CZE48158.1 Uncharacterized conserved protein [Campylobacter geochelonis]
MGRIILVGLLFISILLAKDINVVVFLTDKAKFDNAFLVTSGLQKTLQKDEKADIELVLGGSSVEVFASKSKKDLDMQEKIKALVAMPNVRVVACSGAMKRSGIDKSWLSTGVKTVKAAPREVVLKQLDGYALLQP